jgi:E3 ubiquitin-protein ligase NEDD4
MSNRLALTGSDDQMVARDLGKVTGSDDQMLSRDLRNYSNNQVVLGKVIINLSTHLDEPLLSLNAKTTSNISLSSDADDVPRSPLLPNSISAPLKTEGFSAFEDSLGRLPAGWERKEDNLGRTYYVDHNTRATSWSRPTNPASSSAIVPSTEITPPVASLSSTGELPLGWEMKHTPEGRPYFIDHNTKKTSWVDPRRQ